MIIGILLLLILLLLFDFTGYVVLKTKKPLITVPLGAIIFFGFFQLYALFFMVYHGNFLIFKYTCLILMIITYGLLFLKYRNYWSYLKNKLTNKYFIMVLILAIIFAIILGCVSLSLADSWLYGPLTFSSLDNNVIFSNNGVNVNGDIMSFHYTDGIYLFLSFLISYINLDQYVALMVFGKAFEAILIIFTIASVCEVLFAKQKMFMFWIIGILAILGVNFFTQYPQDSEIYGHTFISVPMGINFFNSVGVFVLLLTALKYINYQSVFKYMLIPIVINAMFCFTSSSLFICSCFLIILTIYEIILRKRKDNLSSILYGFGVVASYAVIYLFNKHIILMLALLVIGWLILILITRFFNKLSIKRLRTIVIVLCAIYLIATIIGFLFLHNSLDIMQNIINLNHDKIYDKAPNYYFNVFYSIPVLLCCVLGFRYLWCHKKPVALFMLIAVIFFSNPIAYHILGTIISPDVYHRIFVLFMPSILMMYGLYQIVNVLNNYISIKTDSYIISGLLIVIFFFPSYENIFTGFDSFEEYKYQSKDLMMLSKWDFPKTKNVNFGGSASVALDDKIQSDNLLRTRGDLNLVDCSDNEPFYIILRKEAPLNLEVEYQTPNYNVYYSGGDVCLTNQK